MRIEIHLNEGETGSPIEFAGAIINGMMSNVDCDDIEQYQAKKDTLAQIIEHIRTYLKYN